MAGSALARVFLLAALALSVAAMRATAQPPEPLPSPPLSCNPTQPLETSTLATGVGTGTRYSPDVQSESRPESDPGSDATSLGQSSKPEDERLFVRLGLFNPSQKEDALRVFGWMDMGYTSASTGSGLLLVAPLMNRFGDEYLLNQLAIVAERPLDKERLSFGFRTEFFSGSDASFLQGPGDISSNNPRFNGIIRQLYVSAHLPVLTEGGVDVVFGRQGSLMGYESYMAPNRPFYSLSYQWNYGEDGADTGFYTTWHVNERLDAIYGVTMGSNTFFTFRGDAPCHIAQVGYWLQEAKKTRLTATLLMGNQAVGKTTPFAPGKLDTVIEWRLQHAWSDRFTQVLQANLGWDQDVPGIGLGQWYGLLTIGVLQLNPKLDSQARLEWFDDVNRTRTGFASNYFTITSALSYRLCPWLTFRPEVRGDFADAPAFGPSDSLRRAHTQLTAALECFVKF